MDELDFLTEEEANQALSQFTDEYIDENSIQYICVLEKRNPDLNKNNFYLEVGTTTDLNEAFIQKIIPEIYEFKSFNKNKGRATNDELMTTVDQQISPKSEPSSIDYKNYTSKKIKIIKEITSKIKLDIMDFNSDISISNDSVPEGGTLGSILKLKGFKGFFGISNWHVLHHDGGKLGQRIYYPRKGDATTHLQVKNSKIGYLSWASNEDLDAAIFAIECEHKLKILSKKGVRLLNSISRPKREMSVKKYGAKSNFTVGKIRSVNCTTKLWISATANKIYRNQIQLKKMSWPGDSGSVLFNAKNEAVGLIFGSTQFTTKRNFSYANNINYVFNSHFLKDQEFHYNNKTIKVKFLKIN